MIKRMVIMDNYFYDDGGDDYHCNILLNLIHQTTL